MRFTTLILQIDKNNTQQIQSTIKKINNALKDMNLVGEAEVKDVDEVIPLYEDLRQIPNQICFSIGIEYGVDKEKIDKLLSIKDPRKETAEEYINRITKTYTFIKKYDE